MKRLLFIGIFLLAFSFCLHAQLNSARLMVFIENTDDFTPEQLKSYEDSLTAVYESDSWDLINQNIIRDKWNRDRDLMSFSTYSRFNAAADIIYRYAVKINRNYVNDSEERLNISLIVSSVFVPYKVKDYEQTLSAHSGVIEKKDEQTETEKILKSLFYESAEKVKGAIYAYLKSEIKENEFLFVFKNMVRDGSDKQIRQILKDLDIKNKSMNIIGGSILANVKLPDSMENIFSELMRTLHDDFPDIIMRHQTGSLLVFDFIY